MSINLRAMSSTPYAPSSAAPFVSFRRRLQARCERGHHARLLDCAIQDQRSDRIQEIHRPRAGHHRQVWRQSARARRPLPGHGRAGQVPTLRGDRVSHLRAGRRLLHLARIRPCRGLPPQRGGRSRNRHCRSRRRNTLTIINRRRPTSGAPPLAHKMRSEILGGITMLHERTYRAAAGLACAALTALLFAGAAWAQSGEPIKIGFSMAMTGSLGPNGKSALLAQKIWEEDVNAKGGLLGRPVKLIYYDDQTNPATVPGIYTKLIDVDKVDLIIGGYGTNMLAPAMPVVMQKGKVFIGLLGLGVNTEFKYPKYFVMIPSGPDPKPAFTKGFFDIAMAQNPKPKTVAIVAEDAEFSVNASDGARENAKKAGLNIVYDKRYPPATTDFAPIVRAIQATNPDLVNINSYPAGSVGWVRAVNEIGFKPKMIGGGMVGLQNTAIKTQLGPLLNGFINYDFWIPVPKMQFPGIPELMQKYQSRAATEGVDRLGYYMAPQAYAQLQVLQQAVEATKGTNDDKIADHIRNNTFKTVLGDVKFDKSGEWAQSRVLQVQFQHIQAYEVAQFTNVATQVVLTPAEYSSGEVIYPYEKAK